MRGRLALALAASVLGLSACSLFERPAPSETPSAPVAEAVSAPAAGTSTAQELMAYMARLRTMNETALNAETSRQRQAMQRHPSDLARLKIAIAMTVAPQGEESDILAIVDPIARRETGDADARAMASFLQGIAMERRRLKESAAAAGVRLRDERRARESEKQRAEVMQERAAQLQQKLDALTDLEKSLSDRQSPTR
jgi:hypothetical protein